LYGCFRLAARINELRKQGHNISTKWIKGEKKKHAQYQLMEDICVSSSGGNE